MVDFSNQLISFAQQGQTLQIQQLLTNARDGNFELLNLNDALAWACHNGHDATATFLIQHGAHVNSQDNCGNTPLHWAFHQGQENCIKLLIENGANKTITNDNHLTPYEFALLNNNNKNRIQLLEKIVADMIQQTAQLIAKVKQLENRPQEWKDENYNRFLAKQINYNNSYSSFFKSPR